MEKAAEQKLVMCNAKETRFNFDDVFPIVEASKLSENDDFLKYDPETIRQATVKQHIIEGIRTGGIPDFRHPFVDPSVNEEAALVFEKGNLPTTGHTFKWWKTKVESFMPSKNSRIGTQREYYAFLGVLIKYLIEKERYVVSDAWEAVCDNSRTLGHYRDSLETKEHNFEPTGSRLVGKWHDLANTFKIVMGDDGKGVFLASGYYYSKGSESSLGNMYHFYLSAIGSFEASVAWMVLDV